MVTFYHIFCSTMKGKVIIDTTEKVAVCHLGEDI